MAGALMTMVDLRVLCFIGAVLLVPGYGYELQEVETEASHTFQQLNPPAGVEISALTRFCFWVKACCNAHVRISKESVANWDEGINMYEIVIGGYTNGKSLIADYIGGSTKVIENHNVGPLSASEYRGFSLSWDGGDIVAVRVFNDSFGFVSEEAIISYSPTTTLFDVNFLAVSGFNGKPGLWKIDYECDMLTRITTAAPTTATTTTTTEDPTTTPATTTPSTKPTTPATAAPPTTTTTAPPSTTAVTSTTSTTTSAPAPATTTTASPSTTAVTSTTSTTTSAPAPATTTTAPPSTTAVTSTTSTTTSAPAPATTSSEAATSPAATTTTMTAAPPPPTTTTSTSVSTLTPSSAPKPATNANTNSTAATPSTTSTTRCACRCDVFIPTAQNGTVQTMPEAGDRPFQELLVPATATSAYRRKHTSAEDKRVSSAALGVLGLVIVVVPFGLIVLFDVITLCRQIGSCKKRRELAEEAETTETKKCG